MARIPDVKRDDLPPDQQRHYDFVAGSRGGVVRGPFPALLHSPDVAARIAHVGSYIRFESTLEPAARELAILTVARAWDCQYEWTAHEPVAREAGTRPEAIAAVRDRTAPAGLTDHEAIIFSYVNELMRNRRVPEATFRAALDWLGDRGVTDLTATAGYYSLVACTLNAFVVALPPDDPPLLSDAAY